MDLHDLTFVFKKYYLHFMYIFSPELLWKDGGTRRLAKWQSTAVPPFLCKDRSVSSGVGGKVKVKITQSCPTLCDPRDFSPWNSPGQNTGVGSTHPSPGNIPDPGIAPRSPTLQADSSPAEPQGKP